MGTWYTIYFSKSKLLSNVFLFLEGFKFSVDGNLLSSVMAPDGGFWQLGKFRNDANNPWKGRPPSAPFDQYFYLIMNVAVGGNTFFPNRAENQGYGKPWDNLSPNVSIVGWKSYYEINKVIVYRLTKSSVMQ